MPLPTSRSPILLTSFLSSFLSAPSAAGGASSNRARRSARADRPLFCIVVSFLQAILPPRGARAKPACGRQVRLALLVLDGGGGKRVSRRRAAPQAPRRR